jgi:cytochrome c oxidase subunit 3
MESASVAAGAHAHAHEHHGPPEAHKSSRIDSQLLGVLLFIISEAMLFGSFFTAYFFVRVVQNEPWPPDPFEFPVLVASMNTAILVSSSFTVHYALHSIKKGNRLGMQVGLVVTFLLGAMFLLTQVNEYVKAGFSISDGAFASVFYGLTGLHGLHVFVGLTLLLIMIVRAYRGHFSPQAHMGVECAGIYWHFVDVMWIIVWSTVYLL